MLLDAVAATSAEIAATSARGTKVLRLAELLRQLSPDETVPVVNWLSGDLTQRQVGVGWASLRELPMAAAAPALHVAEVEETLGAIGGSAGTGSQARRRELLNRLFSASTEREQIFLRRLLSGDLRQGALVGVMTDAVARATGLPLAEVRRAARLRGDLAAVAV